MTSLKNKTFFISGGSRGIGKAIALKLASEGAQIVIAAKSVTENPKLGGTIYSAAEEIEAAGGKALAVPCDIRDDKMVEDVVNSAIDKFGGIDGVINNASAISLTPTNLTEMKRYDLMMDINVRGAFLVVKNCLPYLKLSENPHIVNLSPPLNWNEKWLKDHIAYTISKYNMTMLAMGWAAEFKSLGIAANSLWPVTTIATAAVQNLLGGEALMQKSRKPEIMADAVYAILSQDSKKFTGNQLLDEKVLPLNGITNFESYAVNPEKTLQKDLFLDDFEI